MGPTIESQKFAVIQHNLALSCPIEHGIVPAVKGEIVVTNDFFFSRSGVPIRLMPPNGGDSNPMPCDPECLPSQALTFSKRFKLLFVAHSSGFLVARTWAVMSVMSFKNSDSGLSVKSRCCGESSLAVNFS